MSALDSSAMISLLAEEPEAAVVEALLVSANEEGEGNVYAHTVDLIEVRYDLLRAGTPENADEKMQLLRDAGVIERHDMDADFARQIAILIAQVRALPPDAQTGKRPTLALGDAFGVCLANRLGVRSSPKIVAKLGRCKKRIWLMRLSCAKIP